MMKTSKELYTWTLIDTPRQMKRFYHENRHVDWLAFDTEFIPERYYHSKLCLISVATEKGNYVIDVIKNPDLDPFLKLLENKHITKITHAGENDYRILRLDYNVEPENIFDTQLAYGFLDYDYPQGLQVILYKVLNLRIPKVELRSDWEKRPLTQEQLSYAVGDVVHLLPLKNVLEQQLKEESKLAWATDECSRWEASDYFDTAPLDYLSQLPMQNLSRKQKIFLIRMHQWRRKEARAVDRPVNGILKTRFIKSIAKNIGAGKSALMNDRTMPHKVLRQNWGHFHGLFQKDATPEELKLLEQIPEEQSVAPEVEAMVEMLYQLVKLKAAAKSVSPNLVLPKKELQKMKVDGDYFPHWLGHGWRRELLGEKLLFWLRTRKPISAEINGYRCILTMES